VATEQVIQYRDDFVRCFVDTEFYEDGNTIDLISIGAVRSDGGEFYAVNQDAKLHLVSPWVRENVLPQLPPYGSKEWKPRAKIAEEYARFLGASVFEPVRQAVSETWGYYCVAPATRVLTADLRWVPAGDLKVGHRLLAFDENSYGPGKWRRWRPSTVEAARVVRRPCCELVFDDGTQVICSMDHRWLTAQGAYAAEWITTEKMKTGAYATVVLKPIEVWQEEPSYDAGYLAAAFDGEGFLTQKSGSDGTRAVAICRTGFSQKQNAMLERVVGLLKNRGYAPTIKKHPTSGVYSVLLGHRAEVLRLLGSVRPVRLLARFDPALLGAMSAGRARGGRVRLVEKREVGVRAVVNMQTSSGTFIAEGLASHNCDYDHVAVAQMYGTMMNLPKSVPMYMLDLKQLSWLVGNPKHPEQKSGEHNALADARWNKELYDFLRSVPSGVWGYGRD
jgi:hypothetical protein